jgi:hypothetical protein
LLESPTPIIPTVVVVLVVVTVVNVLTVDVTLVELSALVEVELVVTELVTMLVSEVDEVLLVVEPRLVDVDVEENVDTLVVVVDEVLFVSAWAPTIDPEENDKRRARKVTVMRVHMLILLSKPATFALSWCDVSSMLRALW